MEIKKMISDLLLSTNRSGVKDLVKFLNESDYFNAPSSRLYHGNYNGGLAIHSYMVYQILLKLSETFKRKIPSDSIIISGLLHDVCKINFYKEIQKWKKDEDNKWQSYNGYDIEDQEPLGHGCKSIIIISRYIKLTELETYSIMYHMGIPESYSDKQSFNAALKLYPNLILLHMADFMSTALYEKTI